jgi:hypothetical protein
MAVYMTQPPRLCAKPSPDWRRAGAGLGGGSGNAATTLWAANRLLGGIASDQELLEWSGEAAREV